jgi:hypothetical protein
VGKRPRAFASFERRTPLDRNAKKAIELVAKGHRLARRMTDKTFFVMTTLLWTFHNTATGACYPTYAQIAAAAGCCQRTVGDAIVDLEALKLLTWTRCVQVDKSGLRVNAANGYELLAPNSNHCRTTPKPTFFKSKMDAASAALAINVSKEARAKHVWTQHAAGNITDDEAQRRADAIWTT